MGAQLGTIFSAPQNELTLVRGIIAAQLNRFRSPTAFLRARKKQKSSHNSLVTSNLCLPCISVAIAERSLTMISARLSRLLLPTCSISHASASCQATPPAEPAARTHLTSCPLCGYELLFRWAPARPSIGPANDLLSSNIFFDILGRRGAGLRHEGNRVSYGVRSSMSFAVG